MDTPYQNASLSAPGNAPRHDPVDRSCYNTTPLGILLLDGLSAHNLNTPLVGIADLAGWSHLHSLQGSGTDCSPVDSDALASVVVGFLFDSLIRLDDVVPLSLAPLVRFLLLVLWLVLAPRSRFV